MMNSGFILILYSSFHEPHTRTQHLDLLSFTSSLFIVCPPGSALVFHVFVWVQLTDGLFPPLELCDHHTRAADV